MRVLFSFCSRNLALLISIECGVVLLCVKFLKQLLMRALPQTCGVGLLHDEHALRLTVAFQRLTFLCAFVDAQLQRLYAA